MHAPLYTTQALARSVSLLELARPRAVAVRPAGEVVPTLAGGAVGHAGPPIAAPAMCPPMRAALATALVIEGRFASREDALRAADGGAVQLVPNHELGGVGPMAGIVTASMPVWVAEDARAGRTAWCPINEGSGEVLRYGADGPAVVERLVWMRDVLAPALHRALEHVGGVDLIALQQEAVLRGDECHHRTEGSTELFFERIAPGLEGADPAVERFILDNGQFALNLAMVSAKLALDTAADVPGSPLVTAIARNGVEVGIRLSGTGGRWFTGPAAIPEPARLFDGYALADMQRDLGDSAIVEAYGLGAHAVLVSPTAAASVGLTERAAVALDEQLRPLAAGSHPVVRGPDGTAVGLGIDARAVVATGVPPAVHTGIAHRLPGIGQIGGGVTRPPMEAFTAAVEALDAEGVE